MNTLMKRIELILALLLAVMCHASAQNTGSVVLETLDGGKTTPAQWTDGKTPYVVSFWFVGCKFCIEEMDAVSEAFEYWQAKAPFRFIAVCTDDARGLARAKSFVRSRGWDDFSFAFDTNGEYARAMNAMSAPLVFLFDKDGRIVYTHNGYSPGDEEILFEKICGLYKN